uniref:MTM0629 n=1 Tax=Volvox carteri f. nagariensis TaxID=3068 RepID=D9CJ71_VOLCA|nr:MTM0629 [Volvox carteri f. nagariensis]
MNLSDSLRIANGRLRLARYLVTGYSYTIVHEGNGVLLIVRLTYRAVTWSMRTTCMLSVMHQSGNNAPVDCGTGGGDTGGRGTVRLAGQDGNGWRDDDPYSPLRGDGNHVMRRWTYYVAALMALDGLLKTVLTGLLEPMHLGWASAALLVLSGAAMSDIEYVPGALGVKLAWVVCGHHFLSKLFGSWQKRRPYQSPNLDASGWVALATCVGCMLTDMAALGEIALPPTPGSVFKQHSIANRGKRWQEWGYGQVLMRV